MEKKEQTIVPYQQNDNVLKANSLITAKYRGTLLEAKVLYAALWAIQNRQVEELADGYRIRLRGNELRQLTHSNNGSFYKSLKPVARSLMHRSVGMENQEEDYFRYINLINECEYEKGEFRVVFSKRSKDLIMDLSKNYTTLPTLMMQFKSVYAFRLYEILKRYCYYKKETPSYKRTNIFTVEKGIAELKLELGTVNAELDTVRRELEDKEHPDYERAVEKSPEELYKTYADFNRYVLKTAVKEINESSDMFVTYKANRGGVDRSTYSVTFTMDMNAKSQKDNIKDKPEDNYLSEEQLFEFHMAVSNLFEGELKLKDITAISKASDYDIEKIKNAHSLLKRQNKPIENTTGWIISCIQEGYKTNSFSEAKNATIHNFPERENDFAKIEKALLRS